MSLIEIEPNNIDIAIFRQTINDWLAEMNTYAVRGNYRLLYNHTGKYQIVRGEQQSSDYKIVWEGRDNASYAVKTFNEITGKVLADDLITLALEVLQQPNNIGSAAASQGISQEALKIKIDDVLAKLKNKPVVFDV